MADIRQKAVATADAYDAGNIASLDDATKTTLKSAVDAAKANPSLVQDTLTKIKTALGM